MIGVDALRSEAAQAKRHEADSLRRQHRLELRRLHAIHQLVQNNSPVSSLINASLDSDDASDDLQPFFEQHDISNGLDIADLANLLTIATTPPTAITAPIYNAKPTSQVSEPAGRTGLLTDVDAPPQDVAVAANPDVNARNETRNVPPVQQILPDASEIEPNSSGTATDAQTNAQPDEEATAPANVATPMPEEQANITPSTQESFEQRPSSQPANTVHLPPEDVQEANLRDREAEEEHRRRLDPDSKVDQHLAPPPHETASSPSSTVDAHSAATPNALPQESPDTSPDSDTSAQEEITPPKELQPTPEQQREKEEHDRQLEAQKELARKAALGDVAETPDDQLRWEEKEAAAREAEERAAREDIGGPEPDTKNTRDATEAEQVAGQLDSHAPKNESSASQGDKSADEPVGEASKDSDRVAVAPDIELSVSKASKQQDAEDMMSSPPQLDRMTTRVSSGAMRQKSVSEILGRSASPNNSLVGHKGLTSPEPASPLAHRASTSISHQTRQQPRPRVSSRSSELVDAALEELEVLKGAAGDPERDYLEPLFKIQAHESQNSNTRTLGELIKMVPKALSTEDHLTALHERLDFRMLRRIYQLQNANKWSLRQMEKCKEPDAPVTHHDHMMNEMKWMRKDFREERKLKKSVCAWLAQRCADWVAADADARSRMQVKVKAPASKLDDDASNAVPELEQAGDSAPEDDFSPPTPRALTPLPTTLVVAPELSEAVESLQKIGKLHKALVSLPKTGLLDLHLKHKREPVTPVSKYVEGKVLPKPAGPPRKRSRYDYEDEALALESQPDAKRLRESEQLPAESPECSLFLAENKPIRDRLHSNNAFRPPSEFIMPSTSFYEFRSGSQWIWEDDQKLRKLAKEYSFNWSLIADEMALPTRYKTSADRRTPWECFERWVELESLPADMRKTVYFKTWFQRLEQSQQAAEKRYQQHVAHIQAQAAQNGAPTQVPLRRRTIPTRVEKRRSARYLWMVDGFRKLAKKREQQAWKQAETARVAAQRKSQPETSQVPKMVKMTPQEFSKKRQECDLKQQEQIRAHRQKMMEQQRALQLARQNQQQQQGMPNGMQAQQRPPGSNPQQQQMQTNGQPMPNGSGQTPNQQQMRPSVQMAPQRNGHLAPPQVNGQGIPQAQMQGRNMAQHPNMQAMMQQANAQGRNPQFAGQQYQMQNGNMSSPGVSGMTTQQQLQMNQALLAKNMSLNQQQMGNGGHSSNQNNQNSAAQQMSGSPSMPPPPTPQNHPQQLSSGHVPAIVRLQSQLRASNPNASNDDILAMATQQMKNQSQTSNQARQSAMNAAAGIGQAMPQHMGHAQSSYQLNGQMPSANSVQGMYMNGGDNTQQQQPPQASMSPVVNNSNNNSSSPAGAQHMYAQMMSKRQALQMQQMQSPNGSHAQLANGSPGLAHASPNMTPASPSMQYNNMNMGGGMSTPMSGMNSGQQGRPPSRNTTPQMQRLGSSGGMSNGMQSPGALPQSSPRNMQASMAR